MGKNCNPHLLPSFNILHIVVGNQVRGVVEQDDINLVYMGKYISTLKEQ